MITNRTIKYCARLIGLLVTTFSLSTLAAEWNINEFKVDQEKLLNQEIQTFEKNFKQDPKQEGETKGVLGVFLIKAPYDVVWKVISDWEAQSEFVPGLDYFKVKHLFEGGNNNNWHSLVEGMLDIPFVSFRYTLDATFNKADGTMIWKMLSADDIKRYKAQGIPVQLSDEDRLKNIEGYGQIKAFDETRTVYYYAPIIEVSIPIPGFVEDMISKVSLSRYLHAIQEEAEKQYKQQKKQ